MSTREAADTDSESGTGSGKTTPDGTVSRSDPLSGTGATERVLRARDGEEFAAVLDLLEDEYTRRILEVLAEGARPACELVDDCDASRATVYRRLNRLQDHGLVEVGVELHRECHHRKVFESVLERATVEIDGAAATLRLVLATPDHRGDSPSHVSPA